MNTKKYQKNISKFIDKALKPKARLKIIKLINNNPKAKKDYQDMLYIKTLLNKESEKLSPTKDFKIDKKIKKENKIKSKLLSILDYIIWNKSKIVIISLIILIISLIINYKIY